MHCPRCDAPDCPIVARAPDGSGAWELRYCPACDFSWRSTEEPEVIDPSKRDPWFNLSAGELADMPTVSPLPPLKKPEGK